MFLGRSQFTTSFCTFTRTCVLNKRKCVSFNDAANYWDYIALVNDEWAFSVGGLTLTGGNRSTWRKICPSTTSSTTKPIRIFLWRFETIPGHGLPFRGFAITLTGHTTLSTIPLDERSARRREFYLTTHNSHKRQTSVPPAGFETTIPASKRLQTEALGRAVKGIGPVRIGPELNPVSNARARRLTAWATAQPTKYTVVSCE